jgi:hypothetical protein
MKLDKLFSHLVQNNSSVLFYPSCGCENISSELFDLPYDVFVLSDYGRMNRDHEFIDFIRNPTVDRSNYQALIDHYKLPSSTEMLAFWDHFRSKLPRQSLSDREPRIVIHLARKDMIYFSLGKKQVILLLWDNNIALALLKSMGVIISCFVGVNDGCQEGGNYECVNSEYWLRRVFDLMHEDGLLYISDHLGDIYSNQDSLAVMNHEYQITRLDHEDFLRDLPIDKLPFRPLFCKEPDIHLHLVSSR